MFDLSNEEIMTSIAKKLGEGSITAEEAEKLLNTVARFEERVSFPNHVHPKQSQ